MSNNGGSEDLYIKLITSGIRAIKLNLKTPVEAKVGLSLNKLKDLNKGMYDDLLNEYKKEKENWDKRQINKDEN
jgi:hypothetical protein